MSFASLRISTKLLLLIAALLASMLFVGGYGLHTMRGEQQRAARALERERLYAAAVDAARAAAVSFKIEVQEWKNVLLRGHDPADYAKYLDAFRKRSALVLQDFDALERALAQLGVPAGEVAEARRLHTELGQHYQEALARFEVGQAESSHTADRLVRGKDRPLDDKLNAVVEGLQQLAAKEGARVTAEAAAQAREVLVLMLAVMAAVLLAGTVLGLWIARGITHPLNAAVGAARRVADGDLSVDLQARRRDEIGELLDAISVMTANLRSVVGEVVAGARAVVDSSAQVAQGNLDLSQRTEEQASTLEETASQLEELTSTVTQNADSARQASQVAADAAAVAQKGGQVVGQVVGTMDGISASSKRIADIIGVIDGIAFQTNILALNAAVEAARAGEQGRGFAVVAAEVRNLAQRSADAAKEIKALIGTSVGQVDDGARLVGEAGRTMEDIVASVRRVSELIAEIAAASQEQSAGIGQVNTAVAQMDQVVQQNAALVEEATAATEAMKAQAGSLLQVVSRFRLGEESEAPVDPASAPVVEPIHLRPTPQVEAVQRPLLAPVRASARAPAGEWTEF